jgi:hypothetical protein
MDAQDPAGNPPAKLKPRALLFVSEYLQDLNGTAAAIRAGYSPATARAAASRMLTNVNISTAIQVAQNEILKENHVTVSRIVRELSLIAFFDPASLFDETGRLLPINVLPREIRPLSRLSRSASLQTAPAGFASAGNSPRCSPWLGTCRCSKIGSVTIPTMKSSSKAPMTATIP